MLLLLLFVAVLSREISFELLWWSCFFSVAIC